MYYRASLVSILRFSPPISNAHFLQTFYLRIQPLAPGLPTRLLRSGLWNIGSMPMYFFCIRQMCLNHLGLSAFITFTISGSLYSSYSTNNRLKLTWIKQLCATSNSFLLFQRWVQLVLPNIRLFVNGAQLLKLLIWLHKLMTQNCKKYNWYYLHCVCVCVFYIYIYIYIYIRCCATNRRDALSIPAGVSGYFVDIKSFRSHYGPRGRLSL